MLLIQSVYAQLDTQEGLSSSFNWHQKNNVHFLELAKIKA